MPLTNLARNRDRTRLLWPMIGLQRRIMLYVTLGSLAVLLFFGFVSHQALQESTEIIFKERLHLAGLAAREAAQFLEPDGDGLRIRSPDRLQAILALHATSHDGEPVFRLTVWDQFGKVVGGTANIPDWANAEHQYLLRDGLANRQRAIVVHRPAGSPDKAHVVALVPLPGLEGALLLEQGRDLALALPRALQQHLALLGAAFIATGLCLAWLTTRQVVGPLTKLTGVTRVIAAGDLSSPVPQGGQDEVRDLAASFEAMRHQLQESHAQLAEANLELERRVEERTRELELRHAELARASRLLQQREAERTFLLQKTIQAQEEERRRVARELHDAVGQLLSALVVRLSVLEGQAQAAAPHLQGGLAELRAMTSQTVNEVRRLIVDLRPELLDDLGLPAALGWYAEQMLGRQGIVVNLEVDPIERRLPQQTEVAVFRILQEAITNILKHARAQHVHIALQRGADELVGTVSDDGQGFEPGHIASAQRGTGVGLIGMRERVALLGGTLQIDSAPGQGTRLWFRVPMEKGEAA